jgi:hypothetical protein
MLQFPQLSKKSLGKSPSAFGAERGGRTGMIVGGFDGVAAGAFLIHALPVGSYRNKGALPA